MADMNKTARDFYRAVEGVTKNDRKGGYDTQATVRRIEDGVAYVHIPGGVDETPAKLTINASAGDVVQVRVANGRAFLVGNASAPPTDNTEAIKALTQADIAAQAAGIARQRADEATLDAQRAHDAADAAQTSADAAQQTASAAQVSADAAATAASNAQTSADNAQQSADDAQTSADNAAQAAGAAQQSASNAATAAANAQQTADTAQSSASAAATAASNAQTSADNAQTSATTANTAANNALSGLGMVESVVDVVNWFAEHKTLSSDTTVDPNKTYYSYDATTGTLTKLDPVGTENPSALGWYELDDAISQYVASHVATTNDGLYVVSVANGWRVLVSSGGGNFPAGVLIIDPNGNVAQQTTVNGVEFNTGRPVKIGDQTAYINFDGNGHITVIGADLTVGGANNVSGVLTVKDASGNVIGTWDNNGLFATGKLTITNNDQTKSIDLEYLIGGISYSTITINPQTGAHSTASSQETNVNIFTATGRIKGQFYAESLYCDNGARIKGEASVDSVKTVTVNVIDVNAYSVRGYGGIYSGNHETPIGTVKSAVNASSVVAPPTTGMSLCSLLLEAGKWIVTGVVSMPASTAAASARLNISTTASDSAGQKILYRPLNYPIRDEYVRIVETSGERFYFNVYSSEGMTIAANTAALTAIRIA